MPRYNWKGVLQFSLMSVPIRLYKATETPAKFAFNGLHIKRFLACETGHAPVNVYTGGEADTQFKDGDACPVCGGTKTKMVECLGRMGVHNYCKSCGLEPPKEDIGKGYEFEKDKYVSLTPEEIGSVRLPTSGAIEIIKAVDSSDVALPFLDDAYYAGTDVGGEKTFVLFREALAKTKKVAIGRVVIRGREDFVVIRPMGQALLVNLLHYKHEVKAVESIPLGTTVTKSAPAELQLATQLLQSMSGTFADIDTPDRYADAMRAMIEKKRKGQKIVITADAPQTPVVDVLAALKQSLAAQKKNGPKVRVKLATMTKKKLKKAA